MLAAKKKRKHCTWLKQYIRDRHKLKINSAKLII